MSLATDFPKVVVDQSAETRSELMKQWPKGATMLERFAREQVSIGKWERVYKRVNGKLIPAYRRAKR